MPSFLWPGKLSLATKLSMTLNGLLALITGHARDFDGMKQRIRSGFEGECTPQLARYDDLGFEHYHRIALKLLEPLPIQGKRVLEIGCGTGILSRLCLDRESAKLVCGDFSGYMLARCRDKISTKSTQSPKVHFLRLDAESLPFQGACFDTVVCGMVFGMLPHQNRALSEMTRLIRPGGLLALSIHAPDHYLEATDASFKALPKRYAMKFLGYRPEFWPLKEKEVYRLLERAGLADIRTQELRWQDTFPDGAKAFDFYAATSGMWSLAKLEAEQRAEVTSIMREYFLRKKVARITHDVVLAWGRKS